jgi:hypothetical protein
MPAPLGLTVQCFSGAFGGALLLFRRSEHESLAPVGREKSAIHLDIPGQNQFLPFIDFGRHLPSQF